MSSTDSTFEKIQKEIRDTLKREDELKNGHTKLENGTIETKLSTEESNGQNGLTEIDMKLNGDPVPNNLTQSKQNGFQKANGVRRFTPNTSTKGVMAKFFKSRGKVNMSTMKSTQSHNGWLNDAALEPAKLTIEKGKPLRNGFIPAEEKIVKELYDFQIREAELRMERRKSQPNLMAALELEDSELELQSSLRDQVLKPAKSMASLYQSEDENDSFNSSAPCSLKPARSLAALCDLSDEEVEMPGTHSLILQFESMKMKEGCA